MSVSIIVPGAVIATALPAGMYAIREDLSGMVIPYARLLDTCLLHHGPARFDASRVQVSQACRVLGIIALDVSGPFTYVRRSQRDAIDNYLRCNIQVELVVGQPSLFTNLSPDFVGRLIDYMLMPDPPPQART